MLKKNLCLILFTAVCTVFFLPAPAHASTRLTISFPTEKFDSLRNMRIPTPPAEEQTKSNTQYSTAPTPVIQTTPKPSTTKTPSNQVKTAPSTPKKPTSTSTPTPKKSSPAPTPKPTSTTTTSSDPKVEYMMKAINQYRSSLGLGSVKTDPYTCSFAQTRAKEITSNFSHDGFNQRVNNHTLPYPSYSQITENIAMTSDYKQVVQLWINSPGHADNMRQNTPYVCVKYSGNYYAYEGWRP